MDTVGAKLRDARVARGLSIEEIAQQTRIPRATVEALEDGDAAGLPAPVFVRGFVRAIAKHLDLDDAPLVHAVERHQREVALGGPSNPPTAPRRRRPVTDEAALLPLAGATHHVPHSRAMRGGYLLLLVVAVGMLVAAWLMVGGEHARRRSTTSTEPNVPAIQERVDGVSSVLDTADETAHLR